MRRSFGWRGIAVLALCVVAVGGGVAYATIPGSDGTISGCFNKKSGTLRLINTEAGQSCTSAEGAVSWKEAARFTCPTGTILSPTGVCIETEVRGLATHANAAFDCAEDARRLPMPGELRLFWSTFGDRGIEVGGRFGDPEWTDDDTFESGTEGWVAVTGSPSEAFGGNQASGLYRCVVGPGIG